MNAYLFRGSLVLRSFGFVTTQRRLAERNYSGCGFLTAFSVRFVDAGNIIPSVAVILASVELADIRPPSLPVPSCTVPNSP